ncbi:MAG: multifunctional CCA addition/repair protein [Succinivibrio sp.]|nr:multifunctional CCA addition/repair protein [Succinivibrio sp.]
MQTYLVGGAVRDKLLGIKNSDRDYVVVGSNVDEMLSLGFSQVGHDFPVFLHPKTHEEYALARTESKNGKGYLGFTCDFNSSITLEEDLLRRDLTINAIAMKEDGSLIDPYGGVHDLKLRILRHVSPAFAEDPLRVLRVCRFAAKFAHLGFKIAPETRELMQQMAASGELSALTPERVWIELEKALKTADPEVFIIKLRRVGALRYVLPEVDALYGVPGPKRWHPEIDSGIHTVMTLHRVGLETENPVTRFAMLCHDLGKALTPKKLWPHHPDHCELGVKPLKELCARLHVPKDYESFAYIVVLYHSHMHHLYRKGPQGIVDLLDKLDAWRRPERINPWVQCCKCDFLGRKGFENRPFPRADYLLAMFSLCSTVKAAEFVAAGFKGAKIKEQIRQKRIKLLEEFFKTLPLGEINDAYNEQMPAELQSRLMDEAENASIKKTFDAVCCQDQHD